MVVRFGGIWICAADDRNWPIVPVVIREVGGQSDGGIYAVATES
jgi:hypothetical protein